MSLMPTYPINVLWPTEARWSLAWGGDLTHKADLIAALPPAAAATIRTVEVQRPPEGKIVVVGFTMPNRFLHLPGSMWGTPEGLALILVACP